MRPSAAETVRTPIAMAAVVVTASVTAHMPMAVVGMALKTTAVAPMGSSVRATVASVVVGERSRGNCAQHQDCNLLHFSMVPS
jgi:hypothetical protein